MNSIIDHYRDVKDFTLKKPKVGDVIDMKEKKITITKIKNIPWGFNIIAKDENGEVFEFREEDLELV